MLHGCCSRLGGPGTWCIGIHDIRIPLFQNCRTDRFVVREGFAGVDPIQCPGDGWSNGV